MITTVSSPRFVHMFFIFTILLNAVMPFMMRLYGSQMYFFYFIIYTWAGLYALFLAVLVRKHRLGDYRLVDSRVSLLVAVALMIVTRFAFLGMTEQISLDTLWYLDFGSLIEMGNVPYFDFFFPYPPVFAYVTMAISFVAPSVDSFRIVMTFADVGVGLILYKLAEKCIGRRWSGSTVLIYALLPIAIIETGWSGHFEAIANLLLLVAVWFMLARRPILTGLFVGLATATKIYPALLFPVALFYLRGWHDRLKMTLSAIGIGLLTFLPFVTWSYLIAATATIDGPGILDLIISHLLATLGKGPALPMNIMAILSAGLILLASSWFVSRRDSDSRSRSYSLAVLLLGVMLIAMGVLSGIYPLTEASRLVLWRYPADIAVVRGLSTTIVGAAVAYLAVLRLKESTRKNLSAESLLLLALAIALLLTSMSRSAVFGWYLLWSVPFFLLLKNRHLALTVVLCLLLVYPGYTHDNFASLGYQEPTVWSDDMTQVGNWSVHVSTLGSCADLDNLTAGVESSGPNARFWFDTTKLANVSCLDNVTVQYTQAAYVEFGALTEFVTRIRTDWDPTFGQRALFSLSFQGVLEDGTPIVAVIVSPVTPLTNLTWTSWRYDFISDSKEMSGHIVNLTITVAPRFLTRSGYEISAMYTTYDGPLDMAYMPAVSSLMIFVLVSFFLLRRELVGLAHTESGTTIPE